MNLAKALARREALTLARALPAAERDEASAAIARAVLSHPAFLAARTVFVYVSLPQEPDTAAICAAALARGKRLCLPRCAAPPNMEAVAVTENTTLRPGRLDIQEPAGEPVPPEEIDLAIVPCVAASPDGVRLGHGGGYYDAFLAACPAVKLCLCYAALLRPDLPTDPWDIRMDAVITENTL